MQKLDNLPNTGLLRDQQFMHLVGMARSTLWAKVKAGLFPAPIKLASRTTVWRAEDIRAWIERAGKTAPQA